MPASASNADLSRVVRWEDRTAWLLFAGSLLFFACVTLTWVDQHPSETVRSVSVLLVAGLWIWFSLDYLVRLVLARGSRRVFFRSRSFDLATIALPFLRPFLILVYIWRLPVFRRGNAGRLRVRYGVVTVLFACIYVYVCSYLVWAAEKSAPHANIVNFGDAIWWGFTTIATVGYGDFAPVTLLGRIVAVGLMIGGILIVGFVTATMLSALTDRIRAMALSGGAGGRDQDQDQPREQDPPAEPASSPAPTSSASATTTPSGPRT